tara:strand:- start:332 stop:2134 length:1803 start_codon:yes stop_codon:yes gene_type:complete
MAASLQSAVQWLQRGDPLRAETELSEVLRHNPSDVEALHLRAMARGRLGHTELAIADFEAAAARHPQRQAVLNNLANLYRRVGRQEEAIATYRHALQVQPDYADAGSNLALTLAEAGEVAEAALAFEAVLARHPDHMASLNGLGNVRIVQEDFPAALTAFDRALDIQPNAVFVLVNRGCLYRTLERPAEAMRDLDQAVRLAPQSPDAQFQRANTLRNLGQFDAARAGYVDALRAAPLRADIHRNYASLAWEMGDGARATDLLNTVLRQQPDASLYIVLAEILMRSGPAAPAEEAASRAVALDPRNLRALSLRGELRGRLGRVDEGLADLRLAFANGQGRAAAGGFAIRHQLVEALLPAGQVEEAMDLLEVEPPAEHLQKHVALRATAWRVNGDVRYRQYYDYDRFTAKRLIETPPGYASLEAFNTALGAEIERLHRTQAQPLDQTLFGGTQSAGRLWDQDSPVIRDLARALEAAAVAFVATLPDDEQHPFLRRKAGELKLTGAWSVRLRSGGGHVDHIHPAGWISASYYVAVPESVMAGDRAGWLRLGASGVAGLELPAERYIRPEPGYAVFFPSYMWHGVEPFTSDEIRVTAPFDLITV